MKQIFFENKGEKLICYLHKGKTDKTILVIYGLCGYKYSDAELTDRATEKFVNAGYTVLRVFHRGYPPSEGKFENETVTERISDIKKAIDFLKKDKIAIFAKSLGAKSSLLTALEDKRIKCIVTVSTGGNADNIFGGELKKAIKEKGVYVRRSGTYTKEWYNDFKSYDNQNWSKLDIPVLFIHGKLDKTAGIIEAKNIYSQIKSEKQFIEIKNTGHDYETHSQQDQVISPALKWFDKHKGLF